MHNITAYLPGRLAIVFGTALLLILTGVTVIFTWHYPGALAGIYAYTSLMAYNTAIGFLIAGLGLLLLLKNHRGGLITSSLLLVLLGVITLLDLVAGFSLNSTQWFEVMLAQAPDRRQPMSPTTAVAFITAGMAYVLGGNQKGYPSILVCLAGILIIFIAVIGLLGRGFDTLPSFAWLGIKMAPQTAIGFMLLGSGLITLRVHAAVIAFNRLAFFYRLLTGFIFMSLLFLCIGSISMLQIRNVASLTQQIYQQPLQIKNTALRIKATVSTLNRVLKDIAVDPTEDHHQEISQKMTEARSRIDQDIYFLAQLQPGAQVLSELKHHLELWYAQIREAQIELQASNFSGYRELTLRQNQETAIDLEGLCDTLALKAQKEIEQLNLQASDTERRAANLMLLVIAGFFIAGIAIAALITRSLSWQLQQIRLAMLAIADDKSRILIPFLDHPHEIGDMAKTLAVFAHNNDERRRYAQLLLQHQQDLEAINRRLAQTNKELETFAYVASHDLKSPLRGIAQLSSWIEEDLAGGETEEVNKHTRMMRNRIARMEKLLDDLLVFYRAGKTQGNLALVPVAQMARELFDIHNTKPGLRLELDEDLPVFETLAAPFEQVIRNLFSNAIKHHDREQGWIAIHCNTRDHRFYEFQVCDDGPGIPEKFQERVFGMFQTLKPRDELEGSGMGLALIKKLVEIYGGQIRLHSQGRGCCFTFTWPQKITPTGSSIPLQGVA
ncbi:ATP-binding protein [Cellvibrio japonicus]|nr:ATP-binding protein [Cellvibrio japonicus]QEI12932.1 sensor histidine kinase [Cellvibrio japonicus]QEI16506.1 sensor histidine kinase [Cellvibrio japonicus]QEI20084.1 sensor histidine kinase [Cellvibrio japonicus]